MKILCVFGKHQYGDPARGLGTEYAAFVPALRHLGHEVLHFDTWEKNRFEDYAAMNVALLAEVDEVRPDVVLSVQMHYELWLDTIARISSRGDVATVTWTTDDSWKYLQVSRFIGPYYHAITTTYPNVVPRYHRDGIPNVLLTQWAANSGWLFEPLPAQDCRYQVTFVGAAHGNRKQRIQELRQLGINVLCYGHGWDCGSVVAEEIPRIMRESVISLNFSNSKGANQIKARTFEVPGAGGFLLNETAPGIEQWYTPGIDLEVFTTLDELAHKIRYYLSHPKERDQIARQGYERTKREHTYERRMEQVIAFTLNARPQWRNPDRSLDRISFDETSRQHRLTPQLLMFRRLLLGMCRILWGAERGSRAARRILFESSWRLQGKQTFKASGLPGRLFPYV